MSTSEQNRVAKASGNMNPRQKKYHDSFEKAGIHVNGYGVESDIATPSYTEGHPMVLLEALARRRPVVIFEEIRHVIGEKQGIYVSKRNFVSLLGTLNKIKKNQRKIQKDMKKNKLPLYKDYIEKFSQGILSL